MKIFEGFELAVSGVSRLQVFPRIGKYGRFFSGAKFLQFFVACVSLMELLRVVWRDKILSQGELRR